MQNISILICTLFVALWFTTFSADAEAKQVDFGPGVVEEIYKSASGDELSIYRFEPQNHDPAIDRRPAIIFFFGGGWNGGSVRQFEQHARYFAHRGMVTLGAD